VSSVGGREDQKNYDVIVTLVTGSCATMSLVELYASAVPFSQSEPPRDVSHPPNGVINIVQVQRSHQNLSRVGDNETGFIKEAAFLLMHGWPVLF
jgi:hypothetical protein